MRIRPRSIEIPLAFVALLFQIGCGGTQQPPSAQTQTKPTLFDTHELFYLSPFGDGSPYPSTKIYGYQIEKRTGTVAPVPGSPYTVVEGSAKQTVSVTRMDPAHRFLLVARDLAFGNADIALFTINAQDGSLVLSSTVSVPRLVFGLSLDTTGRFVYASVDTVNGNSIFSFRIDGGKLTQIAQTAVPFSADFPIAIVNPGKPLLHVYGTTFVEKSAVEGYFIQHITTFRIDPATGTLLPTGNTYVGRDLPSISGIDATGKFLFGEDSYSLREFAIGDDGRIEEMIGNALSIDPILHTGVFRILGNPLTNTLYINLFGTYRECAIAIAGYSPDTGAMSISWPSQANCRGDVQLAEATPDFLFGTNYGGNVFDPKTVVVIYRLDQSGAMIDQSYFPVF